MPLQADPETLTDTARWRLTFWAEFRAQFYSGALAMAIGLMLMAWLWAPSLVAMYARLGWVIVPMIVGGSFLVIAGASLAMARMHLAPPSK